MTKKQYKTLKKALFDDGSYVAIILAARAAGIVKEGYNPKKSDLIQIVADCIRA